VKAIYVGGGVARPAKAAERAALGMQKMQLARITVLIAEGDNQPTIAIVHVFENGRIAQDGPAPFIARSLRKLSGILNRLPAFAGEQSKAN